MLYNCDNLCFIEMGITSSKLKLSKMASHQIQFKLSSVRH